MKKLLSLLVASAFLFASCSKDKDNSAVNELSTVLDGSANGWYVSSFLENGFDDTNDYGGFRLFFDKATHTLTVTKPLADGASGTWSVTVDSETKLDLDFSDYGDLGALSELAEDWNLIDITEHQIILQHIRGGGGTDDLILDDRTPV